MVVDISKTAFLTGIVLAIIASSTLSTAVSTQLSTFGDAERSVVVTNWPTDPMLFPDILSLRLYRPLGSYDLPRLIDETNPFQIYGHTFQNLYDSQHEQVSLNWKIIYNRTWVYEDIPTRAYNILGKPKVYLPVNISISDALPFRVEWKAYLGNMSWSGEWKLIQYLGSTETGLSGNEYHHANRLVEFSIDKLSTPLNVTISPGERLALRIVGSARTTSGTTWVYLMPQFSESLYGRVQVPVHTYGTP
ncbi:MAG: hypothetical protein JSV05_07485 [Candidatus Bathyarchaeota archaeon]|nr:MAG: hypothetical protein JSV05_07485 [Candidatus Bathyarchaeota archaeon]